LWVHCQNKDCKYYDARYTEKMQEEANRRFTAAVEKLILLQGDVLELPDDD
jgi:hypothetical protein